jgi:hypothetical protein
LLLLLWFLAFSHRLFLLLGSRDRGWPFPVFYEGDAETFFNYAQAILKGASYDAGVPFHPPVFPYFLALFHALLGGAPSNGVLRAILAAVFSLQVPLLYLLLRRFLARGAALGGALLAVYSFGLGLISIAAVSEGLYEILFLAALILFTALLDAAQTDTFRAEKARGDAVRSVALGACLGLCALTRAEGLGLAAILLLWGAGQGWKEDRAAWRRRGSEASPRDKAAGQRRPPRIRPSLRPWVLSAAVLCLVLAPWTIRNAVALSRVNRMTAADGLPPLPTFVVTTAYGPLNFALANHAGAPGYFTRTLLTSGLHSGSLNLRDPQHREYFVHGYKHGWEFISTRRTDFGALVGRKLSILSRSLSLGWTQWDLPGGLKGTRFPVDLFTPDFPAALWLHLLLLGPGFWLLLRRSRWPRTWVSSRGDRLFPALVLVCTAYTVLLTAAFFGYARQGVLLMPLLFGVEGVTVTAAARWVARRRPGLDRPAGRTGLSRGVCLIVLVLWLVELGGAFQNRNYQASGETVAGSKMLNRDSIMHLEPTAGGR